MFPVADVDIAASGRWTATLNLDGEDTYRIDGSLCRGSGSIVRAFLSSIVSATVTWCRLSLASRFGWSCWDCEAVGAARCEL